jgi:toxin ParE1/3/4
MTAALFAPAARRDILEAIHWIARDNPRAARALAESLAKAAQRLGRHPDIGTVHLELAEAIYRFLPLPGFPHIIVYNAARRPPLILRVLHGARDLPELLSDLR